MLDEYLTQSITILNNHQFFLVGLKKCGRVTTTIIFLIFSFLIFLKQLRAYGGCLGSEAKKDVVSCDKPGGAAHKHYIPGSPNG